jgi:hypothetical protein
MFGFLYCVLVTKRQLRVCEEQPLYFRSDSAVIFWTVREVITVFELNKVLAVVQWIVWFCLSPRFLCDRQCYQVCCVSARKVLNVTQAASAFASVNRSQLFSAQMTRNTGITPTDMRLLMRGGRYSINRGWANREIHSILWKSGVYYRIDRSQPEPDESGPQPPSSFFHVHFNIIPSITCVLLVVFSLNLFLQNVY